MNQPSPIFFCLAVLGITFVAHAIITRLVSSRISRQLVAILVAMFGFFGVTYFATDVSYATLFLALSISHAYFHWFNMSETARRIKILMLLENGRGRELGTYGATEMLEKRIRRLEQLDIIECKAGEIRLKRKWAGRIASWLVGYELILFPERSGIITLNPLDSNKTRG